MRFLLDGASQTRSENGSSFDEEAPSGEAISEFKVTTSTPSAEFGRTSGGIENFVTKQGTNKYHGTVFDIFRNEDLNANSWFNNGFKGVLPVAEQSRGGHSSTAATTSRMTMAVASAGPVTIPHLYHGKDKSFFFFSWEQYRHTLGGPITSTVLTTAERNGGDFSDQLGSQKLDGAGNPILNPCDGTQLYNGEIFDPLTTKTVNGVPCRTAFSAGGKLNAIPSSRLQPGTAKILAFYPTPTSSGYRNNYTLNTLQPLDQYHLQPSR